MTDPTDLIAQADVALDGVTKGPWTLRQEEKWPFTLHVDEAALHVNRYAYGTADSHLSDVRNANSFRHDERAEIMAGIETQEATLAFIAAARQLVPALRDALAAQRDLFRAEVARRQYAEDVLDAALTRAELAECHAEAMEAENARLRIALEQIAETPARRFQRKIARAALSGEPQP